MDESHNSIEDQIISLRRKILSMQTLNECIKAKENVIKDLKNLSNLSNEVAQEIDKVQAMVRYLLSLSPKVVSVPEKWEDVEAAVNKLGFDSESVTVLKGNTFMNAHNSMIRRASEDYMGSTTGRVKRKGSKSKKKQTSA
jgi:predicted nuclease with TOPRIM domain